MSERETAAVLEGARLEVSPAVAETMRSAGSHDARPGVLCAPVTPLARATAKAKDKNPNRLPICDRLSETARVRGSGASPGTTLSTRES